MNHPDVISVAKLMQQLQNLMDSLPLPVEPVDTKQKGFRFDLFVQLSLWPQPFGLCVFVRLSSKPCAIQFG
jgi:hypothetical protein